MNLSDIEKMWEKDSRIDPDNLHTESQNIPSLHAKYHQLHNQFVQLEWALSCLIPQTVGSLQTCFAGKLDAQEGTRTVSWRHSEFK